MLKSVNKPIRKKDAMSLVTGKPVYTNDIAPKDCLIIKLLRSPYARAEIKNIDTETAMKVPGIEAVFTYKDVPQCRYTNAGQTYPEPSPYDRLILDRLLRCVGDPVAIVAGETEKAVDKAMRLIKVEYDVLEPMLDFTKAKDSPIIVHPEDNWKVLCPVGADNKRNLVSTGCEEGGDVENVLSECDVVIDETYHTKANQQTMMETFRTFAYMDVFGRLNIVSSTQIAFHVRRVVANALNIPKSKIRVTKPRIGGGFGAKQTAVSEFYPAFVTWKTGKPSKIIYTRKETQTISSPRHGMSIHVRLGATKEGKIRAIDVYTLSNQGAYGEHGPTTVGLSGHKSIPLYDPEAFRFSYDVVYTNTMAAGAYRGYGATQGQFAVESAVNELAHKIGMDPIKIRELNMLREGENMPAYYNEPNNACALDRCLEKAKQMSGWNDKYPYIKVGENKVRAVGVALSMQGSGISNIDEGSATVKLNEGGFYSLTIGAADMGTGCDTILSQMMAECMQCSVEDIAVFGPDTDVSPYDSGSYASSTTYITGMAVVKACDMLKEKMINLAAQRLDVEAKNLEFDGKRIYSKKDKKEIPVTELSYLNTDNNNELLYATCSHSSPVSPPPFVAGIAEIEADLETGKIELVDFYAVFDCGTVINTNLARVQAEGGLLQGIGMTLFEDIIYGEDGRDYTNSLMQYKIPTRTDFGNIHVEFESSYEPTGPFGAKSIGEVVINTPPASIADAVYNATGVRIRELPITPEKVLMGMLEK